MLDEFILTNREAIIAQTLARIAAAPGSTSSEPQPADGLPAFLDQLGEALRLAKSSDDVAHQAILVSASRHGADLLRKGLTVAQVVHDYGAICQTVTSLAIARDETISGEEFKTLNLCLDDAIAGAVTEYARRREGAITDHGTERLGYLAHELRNLLNTAMLAFQSIKSGSVAPGGSTGEMLGRSLLGLRDLIDRSLADVRLDAGIVTFEAIVVAELVEEIVIGASMHARARGLELASSATDRAVTVEGDRQILAAAISNLLQNAFKFTPKGGRVSLTTTVTDDRVVFAVEDECGGLPAGKLETLFRPFEQQGADRTGIGLGLAISRRAARASGGEILVRDLPGKGCVFSLDVPRKRVPT